MSSRDNASQLLDGPAACEGQTHQQWWQHLWDYKFRKGEKKTCATPGRAGEERSGNIPPTLQQSPHGEMHPMEETHPRAVCEKLQPRGRTQTAEDCRELSCGRHSMLKQGKNVRSLSSEAEGASEKTCDALTTTLIPCQAAPQWRKRWRVRE